MDHERTKLAPRAFASRAKEALEASAKKKVIDKVTSLEEIHRVLMAFSS